MTEPPIKVTKDRTAEVLKSIRSLTNSRCLIGIPAENAGRKDDSPITNAELGYLHEFGSPAQNIPERPFLVPGVRGAKEQIAKDLKSGLIGALTGKAGAGEKALDKAGLHASSAVRKKIESGPFTPLSEKTLAARRSRGRTGEKPLIDTAQMQRAVTYVIRDKDK